MENILASNAMPRRGTSTNRPTSNVETSTSEKEELTLTLKHIGQLKQSPFPPNRWQRFVVATTEDGSEVVFNAEGQTSRHIGELNRGDTVTVSAYRGKVVDREYNGTTTQQTRLNRVYLAENQ